ncbi:MAG: acetate kinase [Gammaproteobacteria bacterium]|nr:acetate kinase [Gammaproteobacteria bacterium]
MEEPIPDFEFALSLIKDALEKDDKCCIKDIHEIKAVGHRVVHGGEEFTKSMVIDDKVLEGIERFIELAPLHNPANLAGIKACMAILPGVPNIAVFDTAFHSTMPKRACLYAIPYELYERKKIRKYGFHGTSHRYVAHRTAELLGKDEKDLKIITCHLGNGASITAVDGGKSVETSMGFTPLEGVIMGTRCGDLDPSVVFYLMETERMSIRQVKDLLNKQSGLLGVSGVSNDLRSVKAEADEGNKRADLAIKMFTYRIKKFIGAYVAVLNGVDAIAFTAGVGENNPFIRKIICGNLKYLGVDIDDSINESSVKEKIISTQKSKVDVLVVPTNEELMIARDTYNIVK